MSTQGEDKITLYRSLFRGRDDIFARRWEKDGKSGYSPAYLFDWDEFNAHRTRGGTLKNFENKTPVALTDDIIYKNLILAFPFSFDGKTEQYVGRLNHASKPKVLIDYRDKNIPFLDRQFKSRKKIYKKLGL